MTEIVSSSFLLNVLP